MVTITVATAPKVLALFMGTSQTLGRAIMPVEVKLFTSILKGPQLGQGHIHGWDLDRGPQLQNLWALCSSYIVLTIRSPQFKAQPYHAPSSHKCSLTCCRQPSGAVHECWRLGVKGETQLLH